MRSFRIRISSTRAGTFRERFTDAEGREVQRFIVYLIFTTLPEQDWLQPVAWDHHAGHPVVEDLDAALDYAEELVLTLIARRLRNGA